MIAVTLRGDTSGQGSRVLRVANFPAARFRRSRQLSGDVVEPRLGNTQERVNEIDGSSELRLCDCSFGICNRVESVAKMDNHQVGHRSDEADEAAPSGSPSRSASRSA